MPSLAFEAECRSDQKIAEDFLSYLQSDASDRVAYEVEPTRLPGGFDARLYRYKLIDHESRVLRILRPEHKEELILYHQFVHQILNEQGLKVPVIHHACGDQSLLGGVFEVMDLVPGQPLDQQDPDVFVSVLGESMATLHGLDVGPVVDAFKRSGVPEDWFLSPAALQKVLARFEEMLPWAVELIDWLRNHLPLGGKDVSLTHGDYHGHNVMFADGVVTGVLDWSFCIADPARDLANMMNAYFLYAPQIVADISPRLSEQIVEGVLKAYQGIRSLDHQRIKAFRVYQLLGALCVGPGGPEFVRKPESQRDYLTFIEQATGLRLAPSA